MLYHIQSPTLLLHPNVYTEKVDWTWKNKQEQMIPE